MSANGNGNPLRDVTRELLGELLPSLLQETLSQDGGGTGERPAQGIATDGGHVPQVPAPPIAAVHRPPGWHPADTRVGAPAPAETAAPTAAAPERARIEDVDLRGDDELNAFARSIVKRSENPAERMAILSGRRRFRLRVGPRGVDARGDEVMRIEKGAVTERLVQEAARAGARLVLARRAVLTPMARDRARSLGVEIEKERAC